MGRLKYIYAILAIAISFTGNDVRGETVSRKEAAAVAELFFNASHRQKMAPPNFTFTGREFTTNRLFIPFYVFNHPTGGFVIISAENKAFPILAYSLRGKLEAGRLNAGQKALFNLYGRHIEFIRYESSIPEEAIKAWNDIKSHIAGILQSQLDVTDLLMPWSEVEDDINTITVRANIRDLQSANYTPGQWDGMISDQLRDERNVVIGIANPAGELIPAVITGRRNDFFRMRFSESPSDCMYRLLPTELLSQGEVAVITRPSGASVPEVREEIPFTFHDSFMQEQLNDQNKRRAAINEILSPTGPVVEWQGSGRFSVYLPENAVQATIYNVAGMRVQETTYRDTNMASVDVGAQPAGFYIAVIRGESGTPYTIRLYR